MNRTISVAFASMCLWSVGVPAMAQAGKPDAAPIVRSMTEYLGSLEHARFNFEVRINTLGEGLETTHWSNYEAAFSRPGRARIEHVGGMKTLSIFASQERTIIYVPTTNRYVEKEHAEKGDDVLDQNVTLADFHWRLMKGPGLDIVFSGDPMETLGSAATTTQYLSEETVNGSRAHRVRLTSPRGDSDIWIAADGDPLLLRASWHDPESRNDHAVKGVSTTVTTTFTGWSTQMDISADLFEFQPPPGAIEVSSIDNAFFTADSFARDKPEDDDLVGTRAPRFELQMPGSKTFSLDDAIKADKVVILEFWRTGLHDLYKEGLPTLGQVASDYRDKGVVVCVVSMDGNAHAIEHFLKENGIELDVFPDTSGEAAKLYNVTSYPRTVLVDSDGLVRAVHAGFSRARPVQLREEIDALLSRKKNQAR